MTYLITTSGTSVIQLGLVRTFVTSGSPTRFIFIKKYIILVHLFTASVSSCLQYRVPG